MGLVINTYSYPLKHLDKHAPMIRSMRKRMIEILMILPRNIPYESDTIHGDHVVGVHAGSAWQTSPLSAVVPGMRTFSGLWQNKLFVLWLWSSPIESLTLDN